jgi:hypothetical protein
MAAAADNNVRVFFMPLLNIVEPLASPRRDGHGRIAGDKYGVSAASV